jgi:hypothetical protein
VTERWGRRRQLLLDDLIEEGGYRKLKEEALARTVWRTAKKRLWTFRKTDYGLIDFILLIHFFFFFKNGGTLAWVIHYYNCFCYYQYIFYST